MLKYVRKHDLVDQFVVAFLCVQKIKYMPNSKKAPAYL